MEPKRTYLQAIEEILKDSNRPLSTNEIYFELQRRNLLSFENAKTPHKTISSRIHEEIEKNGDASIFLRIGQGLYTVRDKVPSASFTGRSENKQQRGFFLVIEGLDGSGKTEVAYRVTQILRETYGEKVKLTFEPHDPSCAGYFIRQVLDNEVQLVSRELLALAFATNRADHYERVINPFIRKSFQHICICDRYYLSSLVYQSKSSEDSEFQNIMDLNFAAGKPDLIIFLNASAETCYLRMKKRQEDKDLFEKNLNRTKKKYEEAIKYLSDHHGERIVEVNADQEIIDVIRDIGKILAGEKGPGWIAFQDPISVDTFPQTVSLTNNFNLTIDEYSRKFKSNWYDTFLSNEELFRVCVESLRESVRTDIDRLSYRDVVSLFISFLRLLGYKIGERLPWSDIDAFHANYVLPGDMSFNGAAIIFSAMQKQITLTRKMIEVGQSLDFLLLFDLRITRYIEYYGRDPLIEGEKQNPPPTFVVNRNHITDLVLTASMLECINDNTENLQLHRSRAHQIINEYKLSKYWEIINRVYNATPESMFET